MLYKLVVNDEESPTLECKTVVEVVQLLIVQLMIVQAMIEEAKIEVDTMISE